MKSQIEKSEIKDFMKQEFTWQSSQLRLQEGVQNDSSKGIKRKSNLMNFLQKIKEPTTQLMEKYLNQNKNVPHLTKNKITLYQDITIIHEFRKYFSQLKYDSVKTTQTICSRLQERLSRAKITIKERITKKLCHLNQQDIIFAVRYKREFMFCTKTKKPIPFAQQVGEFSFIRDKELQTRASRQDQLCTIKVSWKKQTPLKIEQTANHLKQQNNKKGDLKYRAIKLYKYGSKDIKYPIYIHATINPRTIKVVSYSTVMELRKKHKFQQKPIGTQFTPINKKSDIYKTVCSFSQEFNRFVQSQSLKKMKKEQILEYLSSNKDKVKSILQSCKALKDASQIHSTIDEVSKHINVVIDQYNQTKDNQSQKIEHFIVPREQQIPNEANKGATPNQTEKVPDQTQLNERKMLFSVSNSMQTYRLLGQNKYYSNQIHWSSQEDSLLYLYSFQHQKYRTQLKCLLRYKNQHSIIDRIKFLCAPATQDTFDHLHSLHLELNPS